MEKRIANLIIQTPGGTASPKSSTYKISLPSAWIKELGLTQADRQVELCFDGTTITIAKRQDLQAFIAHKNSLGHKLLLLSYYQAETLCSQIAADYSDRTLCVENHSSDVLRTAFGNNPLPHWKDYETFLESRCIPRARAGLQEYLEAISVDAYDPLEIVQKTGGRMAEDQQWLKIEVIE